MATRLNLRHERVIEMRLSGLSVTQMAAALDCSYGAVCQLLNNSYVRLGSVSYPFSEWSIPIDGGVKTFFAFGSKFQRTLPGGIKASPTVKGPYDAGNMPLTLHAVVELHLGFTAGIELVLNARVANIRYSTAISSGGDPAQCEVDFESDGEFVIVFT